MSADETFDAWIRGETGRDVETPDIDQATGWRNAQGDPSFGATDWYPVFHQPARATDAGFRSALVDAVDHAKGSAPLWG